MEFGRWRQQMQILKAVALNWSKESKIQPDHVTLKIIHFLATEKPFNYLYTAHGFMLAKMFFLPEKLHLLDSDFFISLVSY